MGELRESQQMIEETTHRINALVSLLVKCDSRGTIIHYSNRIAGELEVLERDCSFLSQQAGSTIVPF